MLARAVTRLSFDGRIFSTGRSVPVLVGRTVSYPSDRVRKTGGPSWAINDQVHRSKECRYSLNGLVHRLRDQLGAKTSVLGVGYRSRSL